MTKRILLLVLAMQFSTLCVANAAADYPSCALSKFKNPAPVPMGDPCNGQDVQARVVNAYRICKMALISSGNADQLLAMASKMPAQDVEIDKSLSREATKGCPQLPFWITNNGRHIEAGDNARGKLGQ